MWLAHKGRHCTNKRRFRRGIALSDNCPFCSGAESTNHLLFSCQHLQPLWDELNCLTPDRSSDVINLWGGGINNRVRSTVLIVVLWNIWKRRNAKVFRNDTQLIHLIAREAANDIVLWAHRCADEGAQDLLRDWSTILFHLPERL
uniref:Reverse transcriptase zinc-binding domain-containing protein n=1 Tax=Hordeum vulgare subsp. vulgare TaxID=112509 RepID=A0A8I6XN89_HORVV